MPQRMETDFLPTIFNPIIETQSPLNPFKSIGNLFNVLSFSTFKNRISR
ncbi:MAG: hypothetical protein A4E69_00001 [Syntrophus sp. PtaB.Bin138]|nr:MAG: hypothetical protein A4E69_00001 [Syntrophus sp. PtaB.Bin138]